MAIKIKLSDNYTANPQKRIGSFIVTRKWQKIEPELMIIAEKFDPKGNVFEIKKSVSDKLTDPKIEKIPEVEVKEKDKPEKKDEAKVKPKRNEVKKTK